MILWIILGVLVFLCLSLVGWIIGFYNTVINARQDIKNMFSNILTEYQRRVDLFMNLAQTVKGSAKFEKSTLVEVTKLRSTKLDKNDIKGSMKQMKGLDQVFSRMMLVWENYPQLQSVKNFEKMMDEVRITEDRINVGRTSYNGIVRDYNTYITEFPNMVLSGIFGFVVEVFFDTDKKNYDAPKLDVEV
jgi:LemA protein